MQVRILPRQPISFSGRSADDYTGLFWKQVFAGLNPAAQTKFNLKAVLCELKTLCKIVKVQLIKTV